MSTSSGPHLSTLDYLLRGVLAILVLIIVMLLVGVHLYGSRPPTELATIMISQEEESLWQKDLGGMWWDCDRFHPLDLRTVTIDQFANNDIILIHCIK